jgi:hypothetical protein
VGKLLVIDGKTPETLEWDPADAKQTADAAAKFMTLQQQGAVLAEGSGADKPAEQVNVFNPQAEEIIAVRGQAGG